MRYPIAIVAAAALAPALFLTACAGGAGTQAAPAASTSSAAGNSSDQSAPSDAPTQSAPGSAPTTAPTTAPHTVTADPLPPSPPSTGLIAVTTWKGAPAAKSVYVDSRQIVAYRADGSVLGSWDLPGNLPAIITGLTTAFGHSPLATVNDTFGWKYTWDGFVIYDFTPDDEGPNAPVYQWDVTVSHVDGVLVDTVDNISVGTSGTVVHGVADREFGIGSGFYTAELAPYHLSVPTTGSPVLWAEAEGGATISDPITELRGPVASWLG